MSPSSSTPLHTSLRGKLFASRVRRVDETITVVLEAVGAARRTRRSFDGCGATRVLGIDQDVAVVVLAVEAGRVAERPLPDLAPRLQGRQLAVCEPVTLIDGAEVVVGIARAPDTLEAACRRAAVAVERVAVVALLAADRRYSLPQRERAVVSQASPLTCCRRRTPRPHRRPRCRSSAGPCTTSSTRRRRPGCRRRSPRPDRGFHRRTDGSRGHRRSTSVSPSSSTPLSHTSVARRLASFKKIHESSPPLPASAIATFT